MLPRVFGTTRGNVMLCLCTVGGVLKVADDIDALTPFGRALARVRYELADHRLVHAIDDPRSAVVAGDRTCPDAATEDC